jgi:dihydrofolate reductase
LPRLSWQNASVVKGDAITATRELKAVGAGDLTVFGFGQLARALFGADLLDEVRIAINPVLAGTGEGLGSLRFRKDMRLVSCETLPTGVVVVTYRSAA